MSVRRDDIAMMLLDRVGDQRLGLRTRERDWTWDEDHGLPSDRADDPVHGWSGRGRPQYRLMTADDRTALDAEFVRYGRERHE